MHSGQNAAEVFEGSLVAFRISRLVDSGFGTWWIQVDSSGFGVAKVDSGIAEVVKTWGIRIGEVDSAAGTSGFYNTIEGARVCRWTGGAGWARAKLLLEFYHAFGAVAGPTVKRNSRLSEGPTLILGFQMQKETLTCLLAVARVSRISLNFSCLREGGDSGVPIQIRRCCRFLR